MITQQKISVYQRYGGDIDGFTMAGIKEHKECITNDEWYLIENLIQDIRIVAKGLSSLEYEELLKKRLIENCEDDETRLLLIKIGKGSSGS